MRLRIHIDDTLTPECDEAGEVSKVVQRVRDLIISLDECPGRKDFKLKIPPVEEKKAEEEKPSTEEATEAPTEATTEAPAEPTETPKEEEATNEEEAPNNDEVSEVELDEDSNSPRVA